MRVGAVAALVVAAGAATEPAAAKARRVTVQLGVGPSLVTFPIYDLAAGQIRGDLFEDQALHTGLRLSLAAILDQAFVRRNRDLVPKRYRRLFRKGGEVRYVPWQAALVPRTLYLSPKVRHTGVYGATWVPLALGIAPLTRPVRLSLGLGLALTYAFIHSDLEVLGPVTHFFSVGGELNLELEVPLSRSLRLSLGAASALYVPQALGQPPFVGDADPGRLIYHISQIFLQLKVRFPVTVEL
ncbi:MAG: hypothetical protein D6729_13190 [Deltaproteobacteria bacterium]|nr:MAG: hypothetical protein D6729_13190 [Deltaproteobacteria bacterium]